WIDERRASSCRRAPAKPSRPGHRGERRETPPPERLLRRLMLQAFYTIRSESQLMEQLHYNLLYRWFAGLGVDEPIWVPTVFAKKRERLLEAEAQASQCRGKAEREASPTACIIDSQSVKSAEKGGPVLIPMGSMRAN